MPLPGRVLAKRLSESLSSPQELLRSFSSGTAPATERSRDASPVLTAPPAPPLSSSDLLFSLDSADSYKATFDSWQATFAMQ